MPNAYLIASPRRKCIFLHPKHRLKSFYCSAFTADLETRCFKMKCRWAFPSYGTRLFCSHRRSWVIFYYPEFYTFRWTVCVKVLSGYDPSTRDICLPDNSTGRHCVCAGRMHGHGPSTRIPPRWKKAVWACLSKTVLGPDIRAGRVLSAPAPPWFSYTAVPAPRVEIEHWRSWPVA